MTILKMSFSAAVLILAVVVIRSLAINRLPKKTFVALWGVVLCRSLLPFSIPSPLSVYTLVNYAGHSVTAISNFSNIGTVTAGSPFMRMQMGTMPEAIPRIPFAAIVWGIGFAACTLFFAVSYRLSRRKFQVAIPITDSIVTGWLDTHPTRRPVKVRQSDRIKTPLCYGILYPVILLPKKMDLGDERQLQYVLTHELTHIRRFDGVIKFLLTAALCVHWFNPMVWVMVVLANRDIELSCDEAVVRAFGITMKSAYARVLIGMEEKKSNIIPLYNNFSKNAIEERITAIMKIKKPSFPAFAAALLLVGSVTAFFATSASAQADYDNTMTGTVMVQRIDSNAPDQYSIDNGATWISEDEYNAMYPQDDIVWWTYEEYKAWIDEQKAELPKLIGTDNMYLKDGTWVKFTQQSVEESIRRYENILEEIKNGAKLSKTVNGDDNITMISISPKDGETGVSYGASIADENGNTVDLGTFSSKEGRLTAVKQYCTEQVNTGKMSQTEADRLIKEYK